MKIISSRPRPHFVARLLTAGSALGIRTLLQLRAIVRDSGEVVALEATLIVLIWTAYHTYQGCPPDSQGRGARRHG